MSTAAGSALHWRTPIRGGPALVALAIGLSATVIAGGTLFDGTPSPAPSGGAGLEAQSHYGELPLAFEPNAGRHPDEVLFTTRTAAGNLALTSRGATIFAQTSETDSDSIQIRFPGADLAHATGAQRLPGVVNDLRGDRSGWKTEIPTYRAVAFQSAYPGTEIRFHGSSQEQIEYDFLLAPGADPSALTTRVEGAESIRLSNGGELVAAAGKARFTQPVPIAYQPADSQNPRVEVDVAFTLVGNRVGFELGAYDPNRRLVIDPVILAYSTYVGGSITDQFSAIALDATGAAYAVGETDSPDFDRVGGIEGDDDGFDVVVSKLTPAGNALVYSTYLGGDGSDDAQTIAVDGTGAAYVAGGTFSTDFDTANAIQPIKGTAEDVFVSKLSPAGDALVYSTYLGENGNDRAEGIAVDSSGAAYVTGNTASTTFPTANPIDGGLSGPQDAFVSKLNPAGSALAYSTYLGGGDLEIAQSIAIDSSGAAYVTGSSSSGDFPLSSSPIQGTLNGPSDAFVSKVNPAGTALVYSTYLGGTITEVGDAIAVDPNGAAYVTGQTTGSGFPTVNPIEGDTPGSIDAFISKLNQAGTALAYSTYLGGNGLDRGTTIAVAPGGSAYVAGLTASTDFDTVGAIEGDSPDDDAFVAKLTAAGNALDFSTYLGGEAADRANGIAVDGAGNAYVAGVTDSADFNTVAPFEGDSLGTDGFISKLSLDADGDGRSDSTDNCPANANADQADLDGDAQGDACDADLDGDGVANSADTCPNLPSQDGCPDVARKLKLSYDAKDEAFEGKLKPKGACTAKAKAKIFRAERGKDPKVESVKTKENGKFSESASPSAGSYYAKAKAKTIPEAGSCLAAKSKKVEVED